MNSPRIPFVAKLEGDIERKLNSLGANPLNLYKVLGHHPDLLSAWLDFAYSLRNNCTISRSLRELMILRGAQISESKYEWHQHVKMASKAGVSSEKIQNLTQWRTSGLYSDPERIAIELMESLLTGKTDEDLFDRVKKHFSEKELVELVLTGSFYAMVPRVLDAFQIPIESEVETNSSP